METEKCTAEFPRSIGVLRVTPQGPELSPALLLYAQYGLDFGCVLGDPSGSVLRYVRPDPASTRGKYTCLISPGYSGSLFAIVPNTKVEIYLMENSTQASGYVLGSIFAVELTDREQFLEAVRALKVK